MNSNLIPFGIDTKTGELLDVSEVKRGKACNCVCPSCKTPLEARQGEKNEWHFAHSSKSVSDRTENECDFSFWTSVLLMAKQMMASLTTFSLPECKKRSNDTLVELQKKKIIDFDSVSIEVQHEGVHFDALITIKNYSIGILFESPNKTNLLDLSAIRKIEKFGVIQVCLSDIHSFVFNREARGKYKEKLRSFLRYDLESKAWLFHPKEKIYNFELSDFYETAGCFSSNNHDFTESRKEYECVMCHHQWYGSNTCKNCRTHLYSRERMA